MRFSLSFMVPAATVVALTMPLSAQYIGPQHATILQPDLIEVLTRVEQNELIPITIILRDQVDRDAIRDAARIRDKPLRRDTVINLLKAKAAATQGDLLSFLQSAESNGQVEFIRPLWIHNVIGVRATSGVIDSIATRADVAWINYDQPLTFEEVFGVEAPDPTRYEESTGSPIAEIECGVDLMDADRVWDEFGITGEGVVVGVIDTGCCLTHPDIENQVWNNPGEIPDNGVDDDENGFIDDVHGWNFESNNNDVHDTHGHGSHVSGTVAGDGTLGTQCGMAPNAQIMSLKFFNSWAGESSVWDGMQYGIDNNADILTASLGWPFWANPDRSTWRTVSENTFAAGVITMFAAHNMYCSNPPRNITTPGDVPDMITVGAVDCNDVKADFSSCGPVEWESVDPWNDWPHPPGKTKPTISAPGVDTKSHNFCYHYRLGSGTSMSTPHVAGAAALMVEANRDLDHFDVKEILSNTAIDLGAPGMDNETGWGRVDAYEAVRVAMSGPMPLRLRGPDIPTSGAENDFTVERCTPGSRVALVYSLNEGSTEWRACPGVSVGLASPKVAKTAMADGSGIAVLTVLVPAGARDRISLQEAAEPDTCNTSRVVPIRWQ